MAKEIVLLRGQITLVDDEDYEILSQVQWRRNHWGYVIRCFQIPPENHPCPGKRRRGFSGKQKTIWMHRQIMGVQPEMEVDHIDRNLLNNQKSNLRICTSAQNKWNQGKKKSGHQSRYKGIKFVRRNANKKWIARITVGYKEIYLGSFLTEDEAGRAYDKAALEHFGEFASLNFPN